MSLALALAVACQSTPEIAEGYRDPAPRPFEAREVLWPGDSLTVEYSRSTPEIATYRLGVGDQLDVDVFRHPELALSTSVAPDGTIAFHQVGTLTAAGSTVEDLRERLTQALAPLYPDPSVSIFLKQSDTRTARFLELLLSHPTGALREVKLAADGRVSLPGIGAVELAGRTTAEAEALLNEKLSAAMASLAVYVTPKHQAGAVFSVLGEVLKPGRYVLDADCSLVEALAMAGGGTPVADLERIVVMGFPAPNEPARAHVYDMKDALDHGQAMAGVLIRPRDTVLVMRSGIGDINAAIDLYIRRNLPFNVNLTYRLDT
ncbi:MAG: polysaccharide biosynthesis/export family protein [Planctomycetota bacterium]